MKALVALEPSLDFWRFVRCVMVYYEVDVSVTRNLAIDGVKEFSESLSTMTFVTVSNNLARSRVERSEKRGRTVPFRVMPATFGLSGLHGNQWLRSIQCLDVRLLIATKHQSVIRWIEIQANNIAGFLHEIGIF